MKIATWNINSVNVRLPHILDWLAKNEPDVLCLQEIKCINEKFPDEAFGDAGYETVIYGQPSYNGVAIISQMPAQNVECGFIGDPDEAQKRFIAATYNGVHVVNTYFPNGQALDSPKFVYKMEWMKRLREYFDRQHEPTNSVVLCGDYNITVDDRDVYDPKGWEGQIHCSPQEREALQHLKNWGFVDTFRKHEDGAGFYSWWNYREGGFPKDQGLRIDYIWASQGLAEKCNAAWIDREPRGWERPSDHAPVVAEFNI